MKKIYFSLLHVSLLFLFSGCAALNYHAKIAATWELTEVKVSKRDQADSMMFTNGVFRFYPSGNLEYKDRQGHECFLLHQTALSSLIHCYITNIASP